MSFSTILADIQARADKASPIGSTIKFDFGDNQIIYLDGTSDVNTVSQEDKWSDCLVNMKAEDMEALLGGKLNPMMAFMSGKIKVKGDMGVAMKLQSFLG
jgi:acyl-CoA dehydrogenase